jgi:hypothetical protein
MPNDWSNYLERTLHCYDESLVRVVAGRLVKPRSQWPVGELIERVVAAFGNAAVLDRRLQELPVVCRRLLTCLGHSRQPRWRLVSLLELLAALGSGDGPELILDLLESGLLYPDLLRGTKAAAGDLPRLRSFRQWLDRGSATEFMTFAHLALLARTAGGDLGLPSCQISDPPVGGVHEADGLEWPLRLAALWQQTIATPFRRTIQGDFFKRDLDRLSAGPLLSAPPADNLVNLPDPAFFAIAWGESQSILEEDQGDLRAGALPSEWDKGLAATLASLWASLPLLENWNPKEGWAGGPRTGGNPYRSAGLLSVLLLAQLPAEGWARPEDIESWIFAHHPLWQALSQHTLPDHTWVAAFLLGVVYHLRMVEAAKDSRGGWLVRLSPLGRWMLGLAKEVSPAVPGKETLLVQPNLEVIVYRQALTPALIARLSRFAAWKTLGAACTLQLQADTVYRGLESGLSFESMLQTLQQHSMRLVPPAVVESLRTWADKRDRISVYPSATLFEFASADDLSEALSRGLPGVRLSERLLAVAGEREIDFRHFRLTGTRDYGLPPEKCVDLDSDGVTLAVDLARSDLLLETEIKRFAEPLDSAGVNGRRRYRLTPASLAGGRDSGLGQHYLEEWFQQRTGQPLSPAGQLLFNGAQLPAVELRRELVLHVATPELADGLVQWPGTRSLIRDRLGPTTLVVALEDVPLLKERLEGVGVGLNTDLPRPEIPAES